MAQLSEEPQHEAQHFLMKTSCLRTEVIVDLCRWVVRGIIERSQGIKADYTDGLTPMRPFSYGVPPLRRRHRWGCVTAQSSQSTPSD